MNITTFLACMYSFEADLKSSPETFKTLLGMEELLIASQDQIDVLLRANKKMLSTIEALKKK